MADQVNDDVLVEGVPPFCSHPTHIHDSLGVVDIHVEDGCVDDSSHISGVRRGAGHSRVCSEANLQATITP